MRQGSDKSRNGSRRVQIAVDGNDGNVAAEFALINEHVVVDPALLRRSVGDGRVGLAQRRQLLNDLIGGRRRGEGRDPRPVVRIGPARHVLLGAVINGGDAARGQRERQRLLQLPAVCIACVETLHVMVVDERHLVIHLGVIGCGALQHRLQAVHIVGVVPEHLPHLLGKTEIKQAHAGFVGKFMVFRAHFVYAQEPFAEGKDRLIVVDGSHQALLPAERHMLHRIHADAVDAEVQPHFDRVLQVDVHGAVVMVQVGEIVQVFVDAVFGRGKVRAAVIVEQVLRIVRVSPEQRAVIVQPAVFRKGRLVGRGGRRMVRGKVDNDFDVFGMRGGDQVLEVRNRAVGRIRLFEVPGPVAVIGRVVDAGIIDDAVDVFDRLGDPDGGNAHPGQVTVVDFVDDALPVAAAIQPEVRAGSVKRRAGRIVGGIAVRKPVGENLIDDVGAEILLVGYRGIRGGLGGAEKPERQG